MKDLQQDLHSLDDEATQNPLAVVQWGQIHHPELPFLFLHHVRGYSPANPDLLDRQVHRRKIPGIHVNSLVVHMDLEQGVENEGNPKNVENSCHEVVIGKLQQDFEAGNSEKQQVGDFPKAGVVMAYPSAVGRGE